MRQVRIRQRTVVLLTAVCVAALFAAGCKCSQKAQALEQENKDLTMRVADLEGQLQQKEAALAAAPAPVAPTQVSQPVSSMEAAPTAAPAPVVKPQASHTEYVVKEGDSLWKIAKKQLGNGSRYTEILALNPRITKDKPLLVGTKLIMPSK